MNFENLEKLRECCKNKKSYLIIYDGAGTTDLPILVCNNCFQNNLFQKFIKTKLDLTTVTDIKTVLKKLV